MRTRLWVSGVVCASLSLAACGSMGDPKFPATFIPNAVTDLTVVQRGSNLVAVFTIPPLTVEGLPVKEISLVDLRAGTGTFDPAEWERVAKLFPVPAPEKPSIVTGRIPVDGFVGKEVLVGVRIGGPKGRVSAWSKLAAVHVQPPLDTPSSVVAEGTAQGVKLRWQAGNASAWRIFRSTETQKEPALLGKSDKPEYVDTTAAYGAQYAYLIQAEHDDAESEPSTPVTWKLEDTFPPSVPTDLAAATGTTTIELTWLRNTDPDFKGYRVYRAEGDGAFNMIAENLVVSGYSDKNVQSGKRYRYTVAAVDQAGNVSDRSKSVEAVAP